MKNILILALLLTCTLFQSCAKTEDPDIDKQREQAFEDWISIYGEGAEKLTQGIYVKKLRTSSTPGALSPSTDSWVMINHTGREMTTGNVYVTRDPAIAKHQGTFTDYTNYVPQYVPFVANSAFYYSSNISTPNGYFLTLKEMKEGDLWRIYLTPEMAYGSMGYSSAGTGFGGQNALGSLLPVSVDLELVKVIPKPLDYESNLVRQYASGVLGLGLGDTLAQDVYYKSKEFPQGSKKLGKDSTIRYYYVGRFLNGFVFDTNIKDTAQKYNLTQYAPATSYQLQNYKIGTAAGETGALITGMDSTFRAMHYGETGQVIMSSSSAYGANGNFPADNSSKGTIIPPYTPLIFDIEIAPQYGNGTRKYPYMVEAIQQMTTDEQGVWVMGYVAGIVPGDDISKAELRYDPPTKIKSNILLANSNGVTNYKLTFPVLLPEGPLRDRLNLIDNSSNFYTKVNIKGDVGTVFGVRGLVNVTEYSFDL